MVGGEMMLTSTRVCSASQCLKSKHVWMVWHVSFTGHGSRCTDYQTRAPVGCEKGPHPLLMASAASNFRPPLYSRHIRLHSRRKFVAEGERVRALFSCLLFSFFFFKMEDYCRSAGIWVPEQVRRAHVSAPCGSTGSSPRVTAEISGMHGALPI